MDEWRGPASESYVTEVADECVRQVEGSGVLPPEVLPTDAVSSVLCTLWQRLTRGEERDLMQPLQAEMARPDVSNVAAELTLDLEELWRAPGAAA